jgi:transcriptional regulator with XRE-family HTH domain
VSNRKLQLGQLVKALREQRSLSQEDFARQLNLDNRSVLAHLEQGIRIPSSEALRKICQTLAVPKSYWDSFVDEDWVKVVHFEEALSELTGRPMDLTELDDTCRTVARDSIIGLFSADLNSDQALNWFNSILIHYNVRPLVSKQVFGAYFGSHVFKSPEIFAEAVKKYQLDAIRLFNSFHAAYSQLNSARDLRQALAVLERKSSATYINRADWDGIEVIENSKLQNLGYIAAANIKQESNERSAVSNFLIDLANTVDSVGKEQALNKYSEKRKRAMDSLLRKFKSTLPHGVFSPLFLTDSDKLRREATSLAPRNEQDLREMEETQIRGARNLARYLSADHLDVYVATSMRSQADFVSVNQFVTALFEDPEIKKLKLRYFNPTQSWIQDRVAKGLVEALMLRRADLTIYMAQKEDSFGKDSEASVALGQGKPVIVYVPRLYAPFGNVDSEALAKKTRDELVSIIGREGSAEDADIDETVDHTGLLSKILEIRLSKLTLEDLSEIANLHWADFGLASEDERIKDEAARVPFRSWLDRVRSDGRNCPIPVDLREDFVKLLVSVATNFEKRARVFREQHPLALQVILQTGVLNGMIVVRSVESCAHLLKGLLLNELDLELFVDENNYMLTERLTRSTIRVISRHPLINSAFSTFYAGSVFAGVAYAPAQ